MVEAIVCMYEKKKMLEVIPAKWQLSMSLAWEVDKAVYYIIRIRIRATKFNTTFNSAIMECCTYTSFTNRKWLMPLEVQIQAKLDPHCIYILDNCLISVHDTVQIC